MRLVPERIDKAWIATLTDEDMIEVEARLRDQFEVLDRRHRKASGNRYVLMKGPPELVTAWDRWSRLSMAARNRSLVIQYRGAKAGA